MIFETYLVLFTELGKIYSYELRLPRWEFIKEIPLPHKYFLVKKSNGLPLANLCNNLIKKRLILSAILRSKINGEQKIYIIDIQETNRKSFLSFFNIFSIQNNTEDISDLYSFNYHSDYCIALVGSKSIRVFCRKDNLKISFNSALRNELSSGEVVIYPSQMPKINYTIKYIEIPTGFTPIQVANKDHLVTINKGIVIPWQHYAYGYGLTYETSAKPPECLVKQIPILEPLGTLSYGFEREIKIILTSRNFYLYDLTSNLLKFSCSFSTPYQVLSSKYQFYDFIEDISSNGLEILDWGNETYYCVANNARGQSQTELRVITSQATVIYTKKLLSKSQTYIYKSETAGLFVYVSIIYDSFSGIVIRPREGTIYTYEFNGASLGAETGSSYVCSCGKKEPCLYCLNKNGRLYTFNLTAEKVALQSTTSIKQYFEIFKYSYPQFTTLRLIPTYAGELIIQTDTGFIRCRPSPAMNCMQNEFSNLLNFIPDYEKQNNKAFFIYGQDPRVIVLVNDEKTKNDRRLRIIDLSSPFNRTQIRDVEVPDPGEITGIAVNSTAFPTGGVLFAYFKEHGLKIYRFSYIEALEVSPSNTTCIVTTKVSNRELHWEHDINLVVEPVLIPNLSRLFIYGIMLCVTGMSAIFFLTHSYVDTNSKRNSVKLSSQIINI